jgi:GntR family transcriptional regulator
MAEPLYRQIAEDLRDRIESGELPQGSQVPTELELGERYQASRNTIRGALRWLTSRGLVEARAGQGTFVSRKIDPFVTVLTGLPGPETTRYASEVDNRSRVPSASPVRVEVRTAGETLAASLGLSADAEVVSREQVRYIDGVPWSLQTSFYSFDLVTRGATQLLSARGMEAGTDAYLRQVLGLEQVGHEDRIQVGPPQSDEARFFKLSDDGRIAVITIHRACYARDGLALVPYRVTVTAFPADRNQLLVRYGEVPDLGSDGDFQ